MQILWLLIIDAVFLALCVGGLMVLRSTKAAAFAVLKRNFIGYFSNLTGYVFLCLFVFLGCVAAFWPHDFFSSNLANLAQLNKYFPIIMLVFIPAITMSVWAEERRQGTDELLLTIPAADFDIVIGKYLAAAAIYTTSLLFSQLYNFVVLNILALGDVDLGLFAATYLGYWFIGLAMLAIGMVASFLTNNLTVAFILGAVFNAPLAFFSLADVMIANQALAQQISQWSYSARFQDFGRGVIGLSSVVFFVMLVVICLYFSMVMIGRRHWSGGRDGESMFGHYLVRSIALVCIGIALTVFLLNNDRLRFDVTSEQISSLSPDTMKLMEDLNDKTVVVEAFLSASVPEDYVRTKVDLKSMLREFDALGGDKVRVKINDNIETFSDAASRAEEQYGIEPQRVMMIGQRGWQEDEIFMGAAFTSGLEKVVVPFFDRGIPVEYELVRSIETAAQPGRRKIGVAQTDAQMMGGFDMQRMAPRPKQELIRELEKQYDVETVDLTSPVKQGAYDVILAIQPSSLPENQLQNLVDAVKNGQPTAIFEDPFPYLFQAPGTGQPRQPAGGGMFGRPNMPEPKGDINKLFDALGLEMVGDGGFGGNFDAHIVWQDYNPYPKTRGASQVTPEWVFVGPGAPGADDPLNSENSITSGLKQLLMLFPGGITNKGKEGLKFTSLIRTGDQTGTLRFDDIRSSQANPMMIEFSRRAGVKRKQFVLAALVEGEKTEEEETSGDDVSESEEADQEGSEDGSDSDSDDSGEDSSDDEPQEEMEPKQKPIKAVFVADIDVVASDFFGVRARPDTEIKWQFDNVTFVLNVIDVLAGVPDFVEIRKRQTRHSTLRMVESATESAREYADDQIAKFDSEFSKAKTEAENRLKEKSRELDKSIKELQDKIQSGLSREELRGLQQQVQAQQRKLLIQQDIEQTRLNNETARLERDRDRQLKKINRDLEREIRNVQTRFKMLAFPSIIPPVLVGVIVFFSRRAREREGISSERRR